MPTPSSRPRASHGGPTATTPRPPPPGRLPAARAAASRLTPPPPTGGSSGPSPTTTGRHQPTEAEQDHPTPTTPQRPSGPPLVRQCEELDEDTSPEASSWYVAFWLT